MENMIIFRNFSFTANINSGFSLNVFLIFSFFVDYDKLLFGNIFLCSTDGVAL